MDIISLVKEYKYLYLYFSFTTLAKVSQTCKFLHIYYMDILQIYKNNCRYVNNMYNCSNADKKLYKMHNIYKLEQINHIPNNYVSQYEYLKNSFPEYINIDKYIYCTRITIYKNPVEIKDIIIANIAKAEGGIFIDYHGFYYIRDNNVIIDRFIADDIDRLNYMLRNLICD